MTRAAIGAAVGAVCAVLMLMVWGGYDGYLNGVGSRVPPGPEAALTGALYAAVVFWPVPAACLAVVGGLAGLGSWLVRPKGSGKASAG